MKMEYYEGIKYQKVCFQGTCNEQENMHNMYTNDKVWLNEKNDPTLLLKRCTYTYICKYT